MGVATLFAFGIALVILSVFGSENPSNISTAVVELTGHNFDEELAKKPLFVMFHVSE